MALYQWATRKVQISEIVNSGTGRNPDGAALLTEGELSTLRSGGTPASLLSSDQANHSTSVMSLG